MIRFDLLAEAREHWLAMEDFRRRRERCKDYTYGRQWNDTVIVDGRTIREEDYIRSQGHIPLKNNLIRRIVRNVLGVSRNQYDLPSAELLGLGENAIDSLLLTRYRKMADANDLMELYSRGMEEFLISGLIVHRSSMNNSNSGVDLRIDPVLPDAFFIDSHSRDPRGWDLNAIGQLHDVTFAELTANLVRNPDEMVKLSAIYSDVSKSSLGRYCRHFGMPEKMASDFLSPLTPGRCRVIEYWRKEQRVRYLCHDTSDGTLFRIREEDKRELVDQVNKGRRSRGESRLIEAEWLTDQIWCYYYLAPTGEVLAEGESPYPGGNHPYTFKAYPMIDGEIHSFVADCIDQQRYINRLITLYDWIMRASAKGVLLFPEGALPDDVDLEEISEEWSRFNGVILFKPKPGVPLPQQVSSNAANIGITELLQVQLKMMEDVSGVNSALQGNVSSGSVSGTLYNLQTRHALTGLLDLLESYATFMTSEARMSVDILRADPLKNSKCFGGNPRGADGVQDRVSP